MNLALESKTGQGFNEKVLERGIPIIEKELENIFDNKIRVKFKTVDIEKVNQNQIQVTILKQVKKMIKFLIKL